MSQQVHAWQIEATGEEDIEQLERDLIEKAIARARDGVYSMDADGVDAAALKLLKARILKDDPCLPQRLEKVKREREVATARWKDIAPNAKLFMKDPY